MFLKSDPVRNEEQDMNMPLQWWHAWANATECPHLQVARSKQEVFERDLVYRLEGVLHGPNQSEHFEGTPFEGPHLKTTPVSHYAQVHGLTFA